MTVDSKDSVLRAEAELAGVQIRVERAKIECLERVAAGLPQRVDNLAKKYAHSFPDITRGLGSDGVARLRADLVVEVDELAKEFTAAVDEIDWPVRQGSYSNVSTSNVHSALFKRFYQKLDGVIGVLNKYGYLVDKQKDLRSAVLPQDLYDQSDFGELASTLDELWEVEAKVAEARLAYDRESVDSLWSD